MWNEILSWKTEESKSVFSANTSSVAPSYSPYRQAHSLSVSLISLSDIHTLDGKVRARGGSWAR